MEKRLSSHSAPVNLVKENSAGYLASSHVAVAELLSVEGKLQVSPRVKWHDSQVGDLGCDRCLRRLLCLFKSKFLQEVSEPTRWKRSLNHVTKARVKLENRL